MKNNHKDRYEHKLKEFNKKLNSFSHNGVSYPDWEKKRKELLKEYGFTDNDWHHLLKLIGQSKNGRKKHNTKAIGWKRYTKDLKDKQKLKTELFDISEEQEYLNEMGEDDILSYEYWLGDINDEGLCYEDYLELVNLNLQANGNQDVDKDE